MCHEMNFIVVFCRTVEAELRTQRDSSLQSITALGSECAHNDAQIKLVCEEISKSVNTNLASEMHEVTSVFCFQNTRQKVMHEQIIDELKRIDAHGLSVDTNIAEQVPQMKMKRVLGGRDEL